MVCFLVCGLPVSVCLRDILSRVPLFGLARGLPRSSRWRRVALGRCSRWTPSLRPWRTASSAELRRMCVHVFTDTSFHFVVALIIVNKQFIFFVSPPVLNMTKRKKENEYRRFVCVGFLFLGSCLLCTQSSGRKTMPQVLFVVASLFLLFFLGSFVRYRGCL